MSDATFTLPANTEAVIGTCVETLDEDGAELRSGEDRYGNVALCHWFYFVAQSGTDNELNTTSTTLGGTQDTDWGETRFLTEAEWGTRGSNLAGNRIQTAGTAIGEAYGFTLSHTGLESYVPGAVYQMTWYQPKY